MTTIVAVYSGDPGFPPEAQQPGATRTLIAPYIVDAVGGTPTQADIDAFFAPGVAALQRHATFVNDPTRADVVTHLKNDDLPAIEAYVRGKINASSVTDLASAKACMQRIENAMAGLTQAVALVVRE